MLDQTLLTLLEPVAKGITMEQVRLEVFRVSIGHNLYKYPNKRLRLKKAA